MTPFLPRAQFPKALTAVNGVSGTAPEPVDDEQLETGKPLPPQRRGKHGKRLDGTTGTKQPMIRRANRRHHANAQAKASRRKNR